jgi:hypothetical protein
MVAGALVIELARANPIPWQPTPNQEKPTLAIETPENNTAYNDGGVYLNFTVTEPDSWNKHMIVHYIGRVASVEAYLDGNSIYHGHSNSGSYSIKLNQSASGLHTINVTVLSYTYYQGPIYGNSSILSSIVSDRGPVYEYPIVVSDIVYFTVGQPTQSTSPLPSAPEFPSWIILPLCIIVVIGVGLVVYFRKRKQ